MARLPNAFNAGEAEKMGDFTPIPADTYVAQIVSSDMKDTKDGAGKYLQLQFKVLDGEYIGRVLFERLNIQNANTQTVEIAQKALATICELCGVGNLVDSEELHNHPMNIRVVIKPEKSQYAAQNEIKGYSAYEGEAKASGDGGAKATPPWKKK